MNWGKVSAGSGKIGAKLVLFEDKLGQSWRWLGDNCEKVGVDLRKHGTKLALVKDKLE